MLGDQLEVEVGDQLHRPEPAGQALDHVDLGVGEHRLQVASPALGVAGDVAVTGLDPVGQLHPVPPGLPPLDPPQQVRAALPGARRRRHADAAPVGQLPAEPGRLDHTGHRPTPVQRPATRRRRSGKSGVGVDGRFLDSVRADSETSRGREAARHGHQDGAPSGTGSHHHGPAAPAPGAGHHRWPSSPSAPRPGSGSPSTPTRRPRPARRPSPLPERPRVASR